MGSANVVIFQPVHREVSRFQEEWREDLAQRETEPADQASEVVAGAGEAALQASPCRCQR